MLPDVAFVQGKKDDRHYFLIVTKKMTVEALVSKLKWVADRMTISLQPVKKLGGVEVNLINSDQLLYSYKARKLLDANGDLVALVIDPANMAKAILRNLLQGDPDGYLITSPDKNTVYACIKDSKRKSHLPWPFNMIVAISRLFIPGKSGPRFHVEVLTEHLNTQGILVLSAMLDAAKGSGT